MYKKPVSILLYTQEDIDKFWQNVNKTDHCWIWNGYRHIEGYGQAYFSKSTRRAHRISYFLRYGNSSFGILDHLCSNRLCVNPDHLEEVSYAENNRRSAKRKSMLRNYDIFLPCCYDK